MLLSPKCALSCPHSLPECSHHHKTHLLVLLAFRHYVPSSCYHPNMQSLCQPVNHPPSITPYSCEPKHPSLSPQPSRILQPLKCTLKFLPPPKCAPSMLTLPKGTLPPPPSLSICSHHSNMPSFSVIQAFYHARTPSSKYAFPPPIVLLYSHHHDVPSLVSAASQNFCSHYSGMPLGVSPHRQMNWYSSIVLHRSPASDHVLVYTLKCYESL
jgi:hypothetical protein